MAIQVEVRKAEIVADGLALDLTTVNSDYPDAELRFSKVYSTTLTAAQIQSEINAAVALLWQAHGMPQWTV